MNKKFKKIKNISGELSFPGDKSISHRAVMFSAMASGKSTIENISLGEDVKSTIKIMEKLGTDIQHEDKKIIISGCGFKGFSNPYSDLNCGNSGTTARLITGLLAPQKFNSVLTGDDSLSQRPMNRVIVPLEKMGVKFSFDKSHSLPLKIIHNSDIVPIAYDMPIASAQVKSSILIAGLHCDLETVVRESDQTRNHTEKMLALPVQKIANRIVSSSSKKFYPKANDYFVPGDISSAAFHIILTLITPNSVLLIKNVSLNPTRTGYIDILKKMGANISFEDIKISSNEEYGDVIVKSSSLKNIKIGSEVISNIIDEIPILTIAGIFAEGEFKIENAKELRVKESDRIKSMCSNLSLLGLEVEEYEDGFTIHGSLKKSKPVFESFGDHRIAMSFSVLSMLLDSGGEVNGFDCVSISNPQFENQLKKIIS